MSQQPKRLENQTAREVVTYSWFASIAIAVIVALMWLAGLNVVPTNVGIFAAGYGTAVVVSTCSLFTSRLLRPAQPSLETETDT